MNAEPATTPAARVVLFVDDEPFILSSIQRSLRNDPYEVVTAVGGAEAVRVLDRVDPAVVVSDMRMPGMSGAELLAVVRERRPRAIRLLLSGHADVDALIAAINQGAVHRFLGKPWTEPDLRRAIADAVAQHDLAAENERLRALTEAQNRSLEAQTRVLEDRVAERTREVTRLHGELAAGFVAVARLLVQPLETRTPVLGGHAARIAALTRAMGARLGLGATEGFQLEVAATLHDVGKSGLPSAIVERPDAALAPAEREIWARHAVLGEALLREVGGMGEAARIVRHHHERHDGLGTPDGLVRDEIPLGARIVAVADAYDKALFSRGTYATASRAGALESVRGRGRAWFDPVVVDALAAVLAEAPASPDAEDVIDVAPTDLVPGMTLAADLRTAKGVRLVAKGTTLDEAQLARNLRGYLEHLERDPIAEPVRILRRRRPTGVIPVPPVGPGR